MTDRRALFFVGAAVVCLLLAPVAEHHIRWVPIVTAITYVVLAIASALDAKTRSEL